MKWKRELLYVARNAHGVIVGVSDVEPCNYIIDRLRGCTGHSEVSEGVVRLHQGGDRYYRGITKVDPNNQERMEIR